MTDRPVHVVECDGSPAAAQAVMAALAAALDGSGPAVLPVPAAPRAARDRMLAAARPELGADEHIALLVATSGSAGEVKLVELSAAALLASAEATHERLGGPGSWLLALPMAHIAGLQVLARSALAGTRPVVLDLRAGFRPDTFAAAAMDIGRAATGSGGERRYTALVPTQLARLLDTGDAGLAAFDGVLVGGAAAPAALIRRARQAGVRAITTYGMTETAGGCVYDGHPLPGVRARIDAERRICLAGPMLAGGYRLRPDLTAAAFGDGWFRTEDLGRLHADGRLEVLGRRDDVIVTGGHKVAPALVERELGSCQGVGEACVVGLPDRQWGQLVAAAVTAADPAAPPNAEELRERIRELAGPAAAPKLVVVLAELPRLGIGKVDREAVQRLLAARTRGAQ